MVEVIGMLTRQDRTVANARALFAAAARAPTEYWGFKDTAISTADAIESFAEEEADCLKAARFAFEQGCAFLIGCAYHASVVVLLKGTGVRYLPTFGRRGGVPRLLYGTRQEILDDALRILAGGAAGLCLSMYRYQDGSPEELALAISDQVKPSPVVITGSINNFARLKAVREIQPWGLTVGTALFDEAFGTGLDWAEQISVMQTVLKLKPTHSGNGGSRP
jgi:hypothetical protein